MMARTGLNLNDFYTANLMIRALVVEGAGKIQVMELKPTDISATEVTQKSSGHYLKF